MATSAVAPTAIAAPTATTTASTAPATPAANAAPSSAPAPVFKGPGLRGYSSVAILPTGL